jgi:HEAT repeat protein
MIAGIPSTADAGWKAVAPLPEPRWFHAAGLGSDGKIYALAGKVALPNPTPSAPPVPLKAWAKHGVVRYDPASNAWERVQELMQPDRVLLGFAGHREFWSYPGSFPAYLPHAGRPLGDSAKIDAGIGEVGPGGRIFWEPLLYDPAREAWVDPPSVPVRVLQRTRILRGSDPGYRRSSAACAVSPDGKLYRIGGATRRRGARDTLRTERGHDSGDEIRVGASMESFDPATGMWTQHAPMRWPRQLHAAVFGPDGKLYVFGGYAGLGWMELHEGDPEQGEKMAREELLASRALDSVEAYDPATDTWEPRSPMPEGVQNTGAALGADGRIYVVGGSPSFRGPVSRDTVLVYDVAEDTWYEGPPLLTPRYSHAVIGTPEGLIYAIGGVGAGGGTIELLRRLTGKEQDPYLASVEVLDTRPFAGKPVASRRPPHRVDPRKSMKDLAARLGAEDRDSRRQAAIGLSRLVVRGDREWVEPLAASLSDSDAEVRKAAASALTWIGVAAGPALPSLDPLLSDSDRDVRWAAVDAILAIAAAEDRARLIPVLLELQRSLDRADRVRAMEAFGRVGARAVPALAEALRDPSHPFPEEAVEALGEIGEPAVPALVAALPDPRTDVRQIAIFRLAGPGPAAHGAGAALAARLDDEDSYVRAFAPLALARLGDESLPHFLATFEHERWYVRASAAWGLGEVGFGHPEVVQRLRDRATASLTGPLDEPPRRAAAEALERLEARSP